VLSAEEYYRLLAQRVIRLLNHVSANGFVYRVDVRLRPFGDSGPLAVSVAALETYLMQHGRDWERYAYVKARVVNEWSGTQSLYDDILRPFCYRRYLDYGVFDSLRDMKSLIEAEGRRREYRDHLKLGPGGIREIEFIVQSLQLVRGGTIAELRQRSLLPALAALGRHECVPAAVASELAESYLYLRRMENRLQTIRDEQTHDLPASGDGRLRLAFAMGFDDWAEMVAELDTHRVRVHDNFRRIVFQAVTEDESQDVRETTSLWSEAVFADEAATQLAELGYSNPDVILERLRRLRRSSLYERIDNRGRERLDRLVPTLVTEAASDNEPVAALDRSLRVVESIGRRSAYFSLLNENPAARSRLVALCGSSDLLTERICAHPLLLDELLDQRIFLAAPERSDLERDFAQRLSAVDRGDVEAWLDALRNFQQAAQFRIAVADLSGALPVMRVSDRLTETAELVLQGALDGANRELVAIHGTPMCRDGDELRKARFAIVGYGKLGGLELGYGSDLDVVFVHDSTGDEAHTDGEKSLDNTMFFGRLARRIIHILTMPTTSGELYEVDTRLRPSGRSGLLVTSLEALERYQRQEAWTWEHQALLRSRGVAGDETVRKDFERMRERVLVNCVRRDDLATEVSDMRRRMRAELAREPAGEFNLKQGRGGIADIEFIVQYLVLREAGAHAPLLRYPDNVRQLDALSEAGFLDDSDATFLKETYILFREQLHRRSLSGETEFVAADDYQVARARVTAIWDAQFGASLL
jgi:glutamate-ammonia-ligase adenylyltransferase